MKYYLLAWAACGEAGYIFLGSPVYCDLSATLPLTSIPAGSAALGLPGVKG